MSDFVDPDSYDSASIDESSIESTYTESSYGSAFDTTTSVNVDIDGDGFAEATLIDFDGDGRIDTIVDQQTGEPVGDPFALDSDSVHGLPMAEIPYHQAQIGPNDCLPTSVAMVLTEITGSEVPQADLVDLADELDLLGPTGMSMAGGLQLLHHYGVDADVRTGSMDELRIMLDNGDPIIIGLDSDDLYGEGDAQFGDDLVAGHAVVITGIDDGAGVVYINDPGFPDGAGVAISIEAFEDAWADADNTMIVAEAPAVEAGEAGNVGVSTFEDLDDGSSLLEDILLVVLLPFNLKI